jgi:2',3'-cyclic-nucleotide 2'-phosphodiesterase (5'-nucleotidase family)
MIFQNNSRWTMSFILATVFLSGCGNGDNEIAEPAFTLQLLHIADADGSDTTVLNSVAYLSGLVHRFRNQYPQQTLLVSSGDNYIPGPRFNAANDSTLNSLLGKAEVGRADIAILNALGVQVSAIGNHELDLSTKQFTDMIKPDGTWPGAKFPYLAYNTDFSTDTNTTGIRVANGGNVAEQSGKVSGWSKVTVGSQTIGIIGASSPVFANITSTGGLTFTPALITTEPDITTLAAKIQTGVDEMTAAGIDKIVLLAHMQTIATEKALAAKLRNVDIIVAGGSNTLLSDSNDALRTGDRSAGDYPFLTQDAGGQPSVVVNVDADYKYLGRFMAPFNAQGVLMLERFDTFRSGAWATTEVDSPEGLTISGTIAQIRDALRNVLRVKDGSVFGKTGVFLEGRRALVRNEETNFGNLSSDANLWYARLYDSSVQISLKNGGGIRSEIGEVLAVPGSTSAATLTPPKANPDVNRQAGEISQLAVETALKFNNKLYVFDVTATQLKSLLEHGVASLGSQGRFPQVAGMSFSYDATRTAQVLSSFVPATAGERIRSLKVGNDVVVRDGAIVGNASRTFRMVTLNFLAEGSTGDTNPAIGGGDGYPFPATADFVNLVKLNTTMTTATAGGAASTTTATLGSEQDAFFKFLKTFHATTPYQQADTPEAQDTRIQNLGKRSDTVLN